MKTALLLFLSLSCITQISFAQAYKPFLVDGAHWTTRENYCDGNCDPAFPDPSACIVENQYSFKLSRDSSLLPNEMYLIENKLTTAHTLSGSQPCSSYYAQHGHSYTSCFKKGVLSEDTAARKVYWKHSLGFGTNDSVFLDFSKNVGDTLNFISRDFIGTKETRYVVDSIYNGPWSWSVTTSKTWALRSLNGTVSEMYLFESIGMNVGFWGYQRFEGQYGTYLTGYCIGTDSVCGFSCVDPLLNIQDESRPPSISLHPNPIQNILTLSITDWSILQNLKFTLTDLLGQTIRTEQISQVETTLNIGQLPIGIYIWHLQDGVNTVRTGKVIHE